MKICGCTTACCWVENSPFTKQRKCRKTMGARSAEETSANEFLVVGTINHDLAEGVVVISVRCGNCFDELKRWHSREVPLTLGEMMALASEHECPNAGKSGDNPE